MDMEKARYGWTTCSVKDQSPHLKAVLTMDGEVFTLIAQLTNMMLVYILANV
jgi:hypothetical protein